jgi:ABC-2 type transport system ATP-binding protein
MIKTEKQSRAYGDFKAVNNVSFTVNIGEIVGILGHNGAGKTIIMKMLTDYLGPSNGYIAIDGIDISKERASVQQGLGYLPETLPLYP